jgi:hypothetical protein
MRFTGVLILAWFPAYSYGHTPVRVRELTKIIDSRPGGLFNCPASASTAAEALSGAQSSLKSYVSMEGGKRPVEVMVIEHASEN